MKLRFLSFAVELAHINLLKMVPITSTSQSR